MNSYRLPISNLESLENLLESHLDATLSRGVMPRLRVDQMDNSMSFISEMRDHSEIRFKIDPIGNSFWCATIEVRAKEETDERPEFKH